MSKIFKKTNNRKCRLGKNFHTSNLLDQTSHHLPKVICSLARTLKILFFPNTLDNLHENKSVDNNAQVSV